MNATRKKTSKKPLIKRFILTGIAVLIVLGGIFGVWAYHLQKMIHKFSQPQPPTTVTAVKAEAQNWTPKLHAVGSLAAVNGVDVTTQVAGQVTAILFTSDERVKQGQPLVQLDTSTWVPQLDSAKASLTLSQLNYQRQLDLKAQNATPESSVDSARATLEQDQASVAKLQATLQQMTIEAPFTGKIGIRQINLGQYLQPGANIASLQSQDPLYVNFEIPGTQLSEVHLNQTVEVTSESDPHQVFTGKVTAMDSAISSDTRSLSIQATLPNPQHQLIPGMFVTVDVLLPQADDIVTLPETAVNYTLYGNSVYVISKDEKTGQLTASEEPVIVGNSRNGKTQILQGLKVGEEVVTTGQMKLFNGAHVAIVPAP